MERPVKYATERKIWMDLFFIPIMAYTVPDNIRMTPATDKAGVIAGEIGRLPSSTEF